MQAQLHGQTDSWGACTHAHRRTQSPARLIYRNINKQGTFLHTQRNTHTYRQHTSVDTHTLKRRRWIAYTGHGCLEKTLLPRVFLHLRGPCIPKLYRIILEKIWNLGTSPTWHQPRSPNIRLTRTYMSVHPLAYHGRFANTFSKPLTHFLQNPPPTPHPSSSTGKGNPAFKLFMSIQNALFLCINTKPIYTMRYFYLPPTRSELNTILLWISYQLVEAFSLQPAVQYC